jgi:hypothetical protein
MVPSTARRDSLRWSTRLQKGDLEEDSMICRMWRGETALDKAGSYLAYLQATGISAYQSTAGNRGVLVLKRRTERTIEWVTVSLWDSVDAIRDFAGDDIEVPVYYPEDRKHLLSFAPRVDHFEIALASNLTANGFTGDTPRKTTP